MAGSQGIRGARVGSGPSGDTERGPAAARVPISYWCAAGHDTTVMFAADAEAPIDWDCTTCGRPAGLDREEPPAPSGTEPYKSHLDYVRERRTDAEGSALLAEALDALRRRRGESV